MPASVDGNHMGLTLQVSGLNVSDPQGRVLLSVPDLRIPAGTLVGVRGPSGAGKSTFLYALSGLLDHWAGTVRWGDTEILSLRPEQRAAFRASNIGFIFQDFLLFEELNAIENAGVTSLFRPRAERQTLRKRAEKCLSGLGLNSGSRKVASFSGGERQRVAIARAMAANAPILLADEPTASLDRPAADKLITDLVALVRDTGATLIALSHDQHLIDQMDRVLTISDGALTEDTTFA